MAMCWTCGKHTKYFTYRCPSCERVMQATRVLKEEINSFARVEKYGFETISGKMDKMMESQQQSYGELLDELSGISNILEWGFGEISWRLEQQTKVLTDIENVVRRMADDIREIKQDNRIRRQIDALELREIAEKLRNRGVLIEARKRFLESIELGPLDYRTYIGLAKTCLEMGNIDEALLYFEKSLPHAPDKGNESYTYRLIGRAHFSKEEYFEAVDALRMATILLPTSLIAFYDLARYSAKVTSYSAIGEVTWRESLETAIKGSCIYFEMAEKEDFSPISVEVQSFLQGIKNKALKEVELMAVQTEKMIELARKSVRIAQGVLSERRYKMGPIIEKIDSAERDFKSHNGRDRPISNSKDGVFFVSPEGEVFVGGESDSSWPYQCILGALIILEESCDLAEEAKNEADHKVILYNEEEKKRVEEEKKEAEKRKIRAERRKRKALGVFFKRIIYGALLSFILGFIVGNMAGCAIGVLSDRVSVRGGMNVCFWVVFILMFAIKLGHSIWRFRQERKGKSTWGIFESIRY